MSGARGSSDLCNLAVANAETVKALACVGWNGSLSDDSDQPAITPAASMGTSANVHDMLGGVQTLALGPKDSVLDSVDPCWIASCTTTVVSFLAS